MSPLSLVFSCKWRVYRGSETPAAMTWTAMTMRVNSRVTRSKSFHPIGLKIPIAYGPMMIPNAVATTMGEHISKIWVSKKKLPARSLTEMGEMTPGKITAFLWICFFFFFCGKRKYYAISEQKLTMVQAPSYEENAGRYWKQPNELTSTKKTRFKQKSVLSEIIALPFAALSNVFFF